MKTLIKFHFAGFWERIRYALFERRSSLKLTTGTVKEYFGIKAKKGYTFDVINSGGKKTTIEII